VTGRGFDLNLFNKVLLTFIFCFLVSILRAMAIPLPPTGIKAQTLPNGLVVLSWNASPSPSVAGYNLYFRNLNEDKFELWNKFLIIPETEKVLWQLNPGTYCFRIRSVGVNRPGPESVDSKEILVKVGDQKIEFEKFPIETKGQGYIDVAQEIGMRGFPKPQVNGVLGYNVYMSIDLKHFGLMNDAPLENVQSFVIKNLEIGSKYYFTFTSVAKDSESEKSSLLSVKAKPNISAAVKSK